MNFVDSDGYLFSMNHIIFIHLETFIVLIIFTEFIVSSEKNYHHTRIINGIYNFNILINFMISYDR